MDNELNNNEQETYANGYATLFIIIMFIIGGTLGHFFARLIKYSDSPIPLFTNLYKEIGSTIFFTASYLIGMVIFTGIAILIVKKISKKK